MSSVTWVTTPSRPSDTTDAVEVRIAASDLLELAIGGDVLEAGDRRREAAVAIARAVGAGGDRAGDRDVGERGEVVQCPAGVVEPPDHLAVPHACARP